MDMDYIITTPFNSNDYNQPNIVIIAGLSG